MYTVNVLTKNGLVIEMLPLYSQSFKRGDNSVRMIHVCVAQDRICFTDGDYVELSSIDLYKMVDEMP